MIRNYTFNYVSMCGCVRGYVHESLGFSGANKKLLNKLILKLQAVKCFFIWVLGAEICFQHMLVTVGHLSPTMIKFRVLNSMQ